MDASIARGIRAVALALGVLGVTAVVQAAIFAATGCVALVANLIHNAGDALTAVPLAHRLRAAL